MSIKAKSKKAFTLVELIVVIAILAVLAGIAIPAVISVINSANDSQVETDATIIDEACKTYYMGIKSGTINKENFTATKSGDEVPNRFVTTYKKKMCARNCTVGGALEYSGLYDKMLGKLDDFGYDSIGNIKAYGDNEDGSLTQLSTNGKETFNDLNYAH